MKIKATRAVVWAASLEDRPAGLAEKLEALTEAGANLEFVLARRAPEQPGQGVVFVCPLSGVRQCRAAVNHGFFRTNGMHSVRVEGLDAPGMATRLTRALAKAGLNLRGFTATAIGRKFIAYLALDDEDDVTLALRALKNLK